MSKNAVVYPYIPNSVPEIREQMLKEIGVEDIMDLFAEIPAHLQYHERMNLPEPIPDEFSLKKHVEGILNTNKHCSEYLNFLGAGCAQHFIPAVCDEINGRGEFLTAYAADFYADHGKWQTLFEFCSLMGELLDMDVVSGFLYDGAQAIATSLRMASRITGRQEVLLPRTMNPQALKVVENYMQGVLEPVIHIVMVDFDPATGLLDLQDLKSKVSSKTAAVLIENPSYLGFLETQAAEIGKIARQNGAEFVVSTDPIALGVLAPPAQYGATIACGDYHPLGIHLQCGGGQAGFIATHDDMKYVSEFKDKMYGLTKTVAEGEYGFGHVLFDRTSFGSREKAKEYTGTSNALWAITAGVYLALMGPKGMAEVGQTIMQKSQYAATQIAQIPGVKLVFNSPFFKEFVVNFDGTDMSVKAINKALLEHNIFGGQDLSVEFPQLGQSALYCVTEIMTKDNIDTLVATLQDITG
ncbi:glycine cleavage system protein P [Candidatus Vecturithrix granuli]|uniref:Glycine cleavage system protein P n=1 Tax=Vecturithrix granuli TaxID=1499967 RepID=A0A081C7F0_VECG1|nr:glycine cleavage system protein P [Candidatus Vecturithrix granuli]